MCAAVLLSPWRLRRRPVCAFFRMCRPSWKAGIRNWSWPHGSACLARRSFRPISRPASIARRARFSRNRRCASSPKTMPLSRSTRTRRDSPAMWPVRWPAGAKSYARSTSRARSDGGAPRRPLTAMLDTRRGAETLQRKDRGDPPMARIVHIALKVEDLEKATKFYEDVFGIYQTKTGHARGHTSRHMTDGNIDLALMVYDSEDEKEAQLAGPGPCIHHWGIEVADRDAFALTVKQHGGTILSKPEADALKFRAPDGNVAEVVGKGGFEKYKKKAAAQDRK